MFQTDFSTDNLPEAGVLYTISKYKWLLPFWDSRADWRSVSLVMFLGRSKKFNYYDMIVDGKRMEVNSWLLSHLVIFEGDDNC